MATRPLVKESLSMLNLNGLNPHKCNVWSNLRTTVTATMLLVLWLDVFFRIIFKWRGIESMQDIAIFAGSLQIIIKLGVLVVYREDMLKVLHKMNHFWPINKYGEALQNQIETICLFARNTMKITVGFITFGMLVFVVMPIFAEARKLPVDMYYPTNLNQSPHYEIAYGFQISLMPPGCCLLLAFDFLFISLILNIICELKLVEKGFENIPINTKIKGDAEESLRELYHIIGHHNLVLECIKDVREIYSFWLINIYFFSMVMMCTSMLSIIASGFPPTLDAISVYGFLATFYLIQLFFYCAAGQYLITESENVSAAVYGTDWWSKTQPELRRTLMMVIQRSNKAEYLTAGRMFTLNFSSFRKVTKAAMSFFTLVETLYGDN